MKVSFSLLKMMKFPKYRESGITLIFGVNKKQDKSKRNEAPKTNGEEGGPIPKVYLGTTLTNIP